MLIRIQKFAINLDLLNIITFLALIKSFRICNTTRRLISVTDQVKLRVIVTNNKKEYVKLRGFSVIMQNIYSKIIVRD